MREANLDEVTDYLDEYLQVATTPDEPTAMNGLQVANSGVVRRIVAAVDASQRQAAWYLAALARRLAIPQQLVDAVHEEAATVQPGSLNSAA